MDNPELPARTLSGAEGSKGSRGTIAPKILLVDDDHCSVQATAALLQEEGYVCLSASGAEAALAIAENQDISVVLSDVNMPGRDGFWLLEKFRETHPNAAFILMSAFNDTEAVVDSIRRGASDYLLKPANVTALIRAIDRALAKRRIDLARPRYQWKLEHTVRERTHDLEAALQRIADAYQNTLLALVNALDARERETAHHSQRVVRYTTLVAEAMGIKPPELDEIGRGALLHDIGKIGVSDAVLLKPDRLTPSEWCEMREHPRIGYEMIRDIPFLAVPASIVLAHQERWDGTGYPRQLEKQAIPIGARIFAVADALDAMTSDRPYRLGTSFPNAVAEICRCSGTQFDPEVVSALASVGETQWLQIRDSMRPSDPLSLRLTPEPPVFSKLPPAAPVPLPEDLFTRTARAQLGLEKGLPSS